MFILVTLAFYLPSGRSSWAEAYYYNFWTSNCFTLCPGFFYEIVSQVWPQEKTEERLREIMFIILTGPRDRNEWHLHLGVRQSPAHPLAFCSGPAHAADHYLARNCTSRALQDSSAPQLLWHW